MWIVTGSPATPNPVNEGVVLLDGDLTPFNVTVGAEVFTVNLMLLLVPAGFPSELGCVAMAVYWPLESEGLALPELQLPGAFVASALATSVLDEL